MTKQTTENALNMAKSHPESVSLLLLEKLNELDLDVEADLCEKLTMMMEHLFLVHCPRDWMHYRMVISNGQSALS